MLSSFLTETSLTRVNPARKCKRNRLTGKMNRNRGISSVSDEKSLMISIR
jgi:hypothetical protein